jgi:multisubunit Na+/H+ antiporter MnhF subunit
MSQAAPVCCADPCGPEHEQTMSAGLPSPSHTPAGSPATPSVDASAGEREKALDGQAPAPDGQALPAPDRGARGGRWAPSPQLARAEILWVILAGVALAVLTSWPLVLHLPSRIAPDLGDPVRTAWQVAYVGHAMLHDPLHLFNANVFYPHPLSLAFSDSLLGYGPAGFFGSGTVAALVRYNLLFLFAWSLCFVGGYLLARELGLRKLGAAAAAAAFAYAPYRVTEAGHLHVISSGGIALALFLLLRGYRRGSRGLLIAGWLVTAWQISLGFTLGLQFAYLLAALALLGAVYWLRAGRPALPRRLVAITCAGIAIVGLVTIYEARPYLKIAHDYPTAKRTLKEVKVYSAGPAAWLSASSENRVWGDLTAGAREHVHSKNEQVLFPGGFLLLLALIGLAAPLYTRRLRIGLAAGVITCSVLALGLGLTGYGYPYRLLFNYAPGWDGVRVPGRVFTLATLFLALLAGAGAQLLAARLGAFLKRHTGSWGAHRSLAGLTAVVGVVIVIGLVGEGAGHMAHPVVPQPARAEIGLPGPLLDMPTDGPADRVWQYYSTNGFYKIPIGNSTFDIPAVDDLRGGIHRFPDKASVEKLRYYGIRTVVLHLTMPKLPRIVGYAHAEPPDAAAAAAKPVAGLGVTRRRVGSLVIYEIGPGPKALHGTD